MSEMGVVRGADARARCWWGAGSPEYIEYHDTVWGRPMHGDRELYASGYSPRALDEWAERCRAWADEGLDVYVYFDNDVKGHAPHDAVALLERLS